MKQCIQIMEVMLVEGWLIGKHDPKKSGFKVETPHENDYIHFNHELEEMVVGAA